ncbi:hypothetical protein THICB2_210010 [Thiomonas sp. CB2]|nr:hypothetical protein THICB2_210010 [Thiomonas sp. CB2]VDY05819.1 protein of unknown function [Thiomonas sp. Bio17B3]VDY10883.1 protein of unknown function [Thiomonas sp. Sup16B3]VDY14078.1 conserved protein of unknown function [Thiomonas sp. OC7]VDY16728.1 protein of unknown function [Thiomonas sp. CB2]
MKRRSSCQQRTGANPGHGRREIVEREPHTWAGEAAEMRQVLKEKSGEVGTTERKLGGSLDSSRV